MCDDEDEEEAVTPPIVSEEVEADAVRSLGGELRRRRSESCAEGDEDAAEGEDAGSDERAVERGRTEDEEEEECEVEDEDEDDGAEEYGLPNDMRDVDAREGDVEGRGRRSNEDVEADDAMEVDEDAEEGEEDEEDVGQAVETAPPWGRRGFALVRIDEGGVLAARVPAVAVAVAAALWLALAVGFDDDGDEDAEEV